MSCKANRYPSLRGKTCVVTGANSGVGFVTARELARLGAHTVLVCRRRPQGEEAVAAIRRACADGSTVELMLADFASLAQVRALAAGLCERHERIDVLVNNVGMMLSKRQQTPDGHEHVFAVNHLAPFLLTNLLLERLEQSAPSRVVNVASEAHRVGKLDFDDLQAERRYRMMEVYGRSKLCNILFTRELARRVAGRGVTANALHPGVIRSGFGRETTGLFNAALKLARLFMIGPERGAKTQIHLAASPAVAEASGEYFARCKPARPSRAARDDQAARRLWEVSSRLVGLG